jgi:hypothetical protein
MRRIRPAGLSPDALDRLALRHCDEILRGEQIYEENFLFELLRDLKRGRGDPRLLKSVAFKGYPTADNRLFEWSADAALHETDTEKLAIFSRYYAPEETLYDATMWKRWVISGALDELPALARERPVVFLGADRVGDLDRRWRLPWYFPVETPATFGYAKRFKLLDACRGKLAEAKAVARQLGTKRPLVLLQGSSFAYWFIVRLFETDPDVFYLDLGQALHAWFFDCADIERMNWGRIFGPATVANPGMREYYRDLGFAEPQTLFKGRSD